MSNIYSIEYPGSRRDNEFFEIGEKCKSDKFYQHHYYNFYPKFIEYYKIYKNLAMLEIGVENKYSNELWLNYFPEAYIYGIDINIEEEGERYKIIKADQSKDTELINAMSKITKPLFLIIDDGSHIPEHQILSFNLLFNILLPGGTYIIEDIETSYWCKNKIYNYNTNYGYHDRKSVIEFFKLLVDDINELFLTDKNRIIQTNILENKVSKKTREHISTITFAKNAIIITKKTEQEIKYNQTNNYYWQQNL